jgi:uncharacterized oxidoreductase
VNASPRPRASWSAAPTQPTRRANGEDTRIGAAELTTIAERILTTAGAPGPTARVVAESLVASDLVGHESHGVRRLVPYLRAVREGAIDPTARPAVTEPRGAVSTVDGQWGFGQLAARAAVAEARRLAAASGVSTVAVRNCNHVGRLGEYVETLADDGAIGLAFCNVDAIVAPYGGRERRLGTNPIAWAAPRAAGQPAVVVDFATAAIAEGKVALAAAEGGQVPAGLLIDAQGRASTDPADFYDGGALLPFGQHKGYGLSVMIEIVGGLLSGGGVSSLPGYDNTNGTVIVAIDIEAFVPLARFREQTEQFCARLQATAPAADQPSAVLVPGQIEARTRAERLGTGVPLSPSTWQSLTELPGGPQDTEPNEPTP